MIGDQPQSGSHRFDVHHTADTHFSWLRTRLSVERTLMSWIRTGISLIGFGFTIFQFFERFSGMAGVAPGASPLAPWLFGLALIAAGTAALVVAAWEFRRSLLYLWSDDFRPVAGVEASPWQTPVFPITLLLIVIGIVVFFAVLFRI
jgi:putative membrane protein